MKALSTILLWLLLVGAASAQTQPAAPAGVACNGISSTGPVTRCLSNWTYGCQATQATNNIIGTDGNRTAILFQNTGVIPIALTFGDSAVPGNGFQVQPGNSFLWSNIGRGNEPGRVASTAVSIIVTPGATATCVFMFAD